MTKPKVEIRIVCPNFGTRGHSTHAYNKKDKAAAVKAVEVLDLRMAHNAKTLNDGHYSYWKSEVGYRIESRTITAWEEIE